MTIQQLPPGIRNNNPGNLKAAPTYDGHDVDDNGFRVYESAQRGIEALMEDLWWKYHQDRLRTVEAIMTKYAPPSENNTAEYIAWCCRWLHISPTYAATQDIKLARPWVMVDFVRAIIFRENGPAPNACYASPEWYPPSTITSCYEHYKQVL